MSSNNAASLISVLNGTNYQQWATAMKAFLMLQGIWAYAQGNIKRVYLSYKEDKLNQISEKEIAEKHALQAAWDKKDRIVFGHIVL